MTKERDREIAIASAAFNAMNTLFAVKYDLQCGSGAKLRDVQRAIDDLDECIRLLMEDRA